LDDITVHCDETLVSSAFLKDYLNFYHPHRGQMVLRNSMEALQSSMKLPVIQTEVLQCRPNLSLHTMSAHYVSKNIEAYIQVNKVPYLFQSLGIQFIELEHYLSFQTDNKYTLIRRRVQENECIICMEKCAYPTIINCCYSVFCGKCVLKNTVLNHKCPICREMLTTNNICCLSALQDEDVIQARNKIEVCLDVLRTNKSEKFIIYSVFENIYFQLFEKMNQMGLTVEKIDSNLPTRLKSIRNFKNGVTNVLFVSDVHLIHGISLAATSHLIFYHELNAYETKQVLIHSAQRLGRTQPLKIIHLNSGI
jgi:SNF2 family DNA or RNA helicase